MKKSDKLFDVDEPPLPRLSHTPVPRGDASFSKRLLSFCGSTSLQDVIIDVLRPRPSRYCITTDRGPTAIDAPISKRLPRDYDPQEHLRINDHFTVPLHGFPQRVSERHAFASRWTAMYNEACGMPASQRDEALKRFGEAFGAEVGHTAAYLIRKVALADLSVSDGAPVGSNTYASSHPFWQFAPRSRLGEFGPIPSQPTEQLLTATVDGTTDSAPRAARYTYNGICYEIYNHRENIGLMGGHEAAMRLASHKLQGVSMINTANVAFVQQAPSAVVEYCGYRVFASGALPVAPHAPVLYGSRYNGQDDSDPYVRSDDHAVAVMRDVADAINVRGHWVGNGTGRQYLYSNGELCLQRGVDNRLYVVSGQERLIPPITTNHRIFMNGYLYRRLRPELVKHSKKSKTSKMPLSSDAFSNFGMVRCDEHDREVALMTEVLKQQILTDATNRILHMLKSCESVTEGIAVVGAVGGLSTLLHRGGVNVRLMGEMSTRLSNRYFRLRAQQVSADGPEMIVPISILLSLLRIEMIARSMKCMIRRLLRARCITRVANFISGAIRYQAAASAMNDGDSKPPVSARGEKPTGATKPSAPQPPAAASPTTTTAGGRSRIVTVSEPDPKQADNSNEGSDNEADGDGDTFQAEEDFHNCFDRCVWPTLDGKFGSGESYSILRFTPKQISVNPQVKYNHVDAIAAVLQHLTDATGITFTKRRAKWHGDVTDVEFLPLSDVADELVNGVARPNEFADFACGEPVAVVQLQATPPLSYESGEHLHLIGIARANVRTASLAMELQYLHLNRIRNSMFLSIVDLCAVFCIEAKLTEDQDVIRWLKYRKDAVRKLVAKQQAVLRKQDHDEDEADEADQNPPSGSHEHAPQGGASSKPEGEASPEGADGLPADPLQTYYVEAGVIAFPILNAHSQTVSGMVMAIVDDNVLQSTFGLHHRDVIRLTSHTVGSSDAGSQSTSPSASPRKPDTRVCVVVGFQRYLYCCELATPPAASAHKQNEADDEEDEPVAYPTAVFAILVANRDQLESQFRVEVLAKRSGYIRYAEPADFGLKRAGESDSPLVSPKSTSKSKARSAKTPFSEELIDTDEEDEKRGGIQAKDDRRRLNNTFESDDACYFFGTSWDVLEYCTKASVLDTFVPDVRSGHRILLKSTGATMRVIGVRDGKLWACQERVDALPRPLLPDEFPHITMLHLLDRVSYDEQPLYFGGRFFQRNLVTCNKFTLYYGQKVLLRSGPLAGVVGIVLGTDMEIVQILNTTSKRILAVPGRTHDDVFMSMRPLLIGCVLDLSVFEPIEPTTFACTSTNGERVILDIRAERLLMKFGVVQGSLVEVLLGPFALCKCRALGFTEDRLWVSLQIGSSAVRVGENALPLKLGEYRVLSEAPVTVRKNPNRRLALRSSDNAHPEKLRLSTPLDPFLFLCATGIPVAFDRHSDVCGVFNLFHGQVVLVAKDVFAKWEPMTVVGVFQGELWVVPDGNAAAVPLDGFSGTELLQNYSVIEVRSHAQLFTFRDPLHLEGFEIMPFTVHSRVTRDGVMVHVLEETGELIGLDKADAAFAALSLPLPLKFGDRVERVLPDTTSSFLANASSLWKRKLQYEYFVVMGTYAGFVYVQRESQLGCSLLPLDPSAGENHGMRVVGSIDVIPMSLSTLEQLQVDLRLRKRKSTESDLDHRKTALEDALHLEDTSPFPPENVPQVKEETLVTELVPQVLDFALHQFCERFGEARIPEASIRLVVHWMLTWFGSSLKFTETKRDGLLKLAAIEGFVLKRPIPVPTMLDYDMFRVRREVQRRMEEQQWGISEAQLAEWRSAAQLYLLPGATDAAKANRLLRTLSSLEAHVRSGEVLPAAALGFSERHPHILPDALVHATDSGPKTADASRAVLDQAQQRRRLQEQRKAAEAAVAASAATDDPLAAERNSEALIQEQRERLGIVIQGAWSAGLQQLRRFRESILAAQLVGGAGNASRRLKVQPTMQSTMFRYKTADGGVIILDGSDRACYDVFQMRRGEVYRYASGDMTGIHIVILGVVEGALWRYEEKLSSQDRIMDEQAHPFLATTGDEIRSLHPLAFVDHREPRSCDPFLFPRLGGGLLKFDMEESSCGRFGVSHGQRYVVRKEPYPVPTYPGCRRGPIITVIGVYGQNLYFAADMGGAFPVLCNDPVKELGLEPLYFTVVGAFAPERKHWFRCPVDVTRRNRTYTVSVCVDTTPSLLEPFHLQLRHGTVVRLPVVDSDLAAWRQQLLQPPAVGGKRRASRIQLTLLETQPAPTNVLAVVTGVHGGVLHRALLHENVARPFRDEEWRSIEVVSPEELQQPWDGGPFRMSAPCRSVAVRCEKHAEQLFQYVDTSGSDSGLVVRPPTKFKAYNTFMQLCLYDQTSESLEQWGVAAFDWVKVLVAQRWKWAVIIGTRGGSLWRIDEENIGVLAQEIRFIVETSTSAPEGEEAEADETDLAVIQAAMAMSEHRTSIPKTVPTTSIFNNCNDAASLVVNYGLKRLGTAKMRGFIG